MRYQINTNKFLEDDELAQLELILSQKLDENLLRFLPIFIALKTGCRRSELLLLKVSSINFHKKYIWIKATKNSNDREMPLEDDVIDLLRLYIQRAHLESGDRLFKMSVAKVFRIWSEVRPVDKKFHSLRHTFAINIYKKHRDIRLVQVALGHRNLNNTLVYTQYVYCGEELRRLILPIQKAA